MHRVTMRKTELTGEGLDELCASALQLMNENKVAHPLFQKIT